MLPSVSPHGKITIKFTVQNKDEDKPNYKTKRYIKMNKDKPNFMTYKTNIKSNRVLDKNKYKDKPNLRQKDKPNSIEIYKRTTSQSDPG